MRRTMLCVALVAFSGTLFPSFAGSPSARREPLKAALIYDFFLSEGSTISDASGAGLDGMLTAGEIVQGRGKNAVKFHGKGMIIAPDALDPSGHQFTVGALCLPSKPDGVLLAMGDRTNGFSLHLKGGVPHFTVRARGKVTTLAGPEPMPLDQWVHLAGAIDEKGEAWLIVNTWPEAHAKTTLLESKPSEPFCVGSDPGSSVSGDAAPPNWHGLIEDVRLYWGFMSLDDHRDEFKDWARMSGCGCK